MLKVRPFCLNPQEHSLLEISLLINAGQLIKREKKLITLLTTIKRYYLLKLSAQILLSDCFRMFVIKKKQSIGYNTSSLNGNTIHHRENQFIPQDIFTAVPNVKKLSLDLFTLFL